MEALINQDVREKINELKASGYKLRFRREATCLHCIELNRWIVPRLFTVDAYYHFEDGGNPGADRTIYAISSTKGLKGFLVDACLVYEDNISHEMAIKLGPDHNKFHNQPKTQTK